MNSSSHLLIQGKTMPKLTFLASSIAVTLAVLSTSAESTEQQIKLTTEVIEVTGTRRSLRSISESTVPVDIIGIDDMESSGQLELSQVLTTLIPSFNFPNSQLADGTDHARPAVLRGLVWYLLMVNVAMPERYLT